MIALSSSFSRAAHGRQLLRDSVFISHLPEADAYKRKISRKILLFRPVLFFYTAAVVLFLSVSAVASDDAGQTAVFFLSGAAVGMTASFAVYHLLQRAELNAAEAHLIEGFSLLFMAAGNPHIAMRRERLALLFHYRGIAFERIEYIIPAVLFPAALVLLLFIFLRTAGDLSRRVRMAVRHSPLLMFYFKVFRLRYIFMFSLLAFIITVNDSMPAHLRLRILFITWTVLLLLFAAFIVYCRNTAHKVFGIGLSTWKHQFRLFIPPAVFHLLVLLVSGAAALVFILPIS